MHHCGGLEKILIIMKMYRILWIIMYYYGGLCTIMEGYEKILIIMKMYRILWITM